MAWRLARSLDVLRNQINAKYPNRSKISDGTIGDAAHATRDSDHNPWYGPGIVTALDITHDPANGVDIDKLTNELQMSRDVRIKYVIANDLIMSGKDGPSPWVWREYSGSNPHTRHFHLSVVASSLCDNRTKWNLPSLTGKESPIMSKAAVVGGLHEWATAENKEPLREGTQGKVSWSQVWMRLYHDAWEKDQVLGELSRHVEQLKLNNAALSKEMEQLKKNDAALKSQLTRIETLLKQAVAE